MAVALTGTGSIWARLGAIAAGVNEIDSTRRGTTDTRLGTTLAAQYATDEREAFATIWPKRDSWRAAPSQWVADLRQLAADTLLDQVDRDAALPSRTVPDALDELIRQMRSSAASLNRPTTTVTVTAAAGNVGDTAVVASLLDGDGLPLDCVFAETLRATASATAGSGVAPFAEAITVLGDAAADPTAYNWPAGSGAVAALQTVDAARTSLVANGGFEAFATANVPDSWAIATGTAGTHVAEAAAPARGSKNVRLLSDGSTLVAIQQSPRATLRPLTVYAITFYAKVNTLTGTGNLRVGLWNGSTWVTDAQAAASYLDVGLNGGSGVDTTYKRFTAFVRTPAAITGTETLRIALTTAPPSGRQVDLDLVALTQPTQLYPGGPFAAAFAGVTAPVAADYWTIAVTNSLGVTSLVRTADRLLDTRLLGRKLPTSGSPTVSDSLVA